MSKIVCPRCNSTELKEIERTTIIRPRRVRMTLNVVTHCWQCRKCQCEFVNSEQARDNQLRVERAINTELEKELKELQATFDLQWEASMRAGRRWRKEKPDEREMVMPDMTALILWQENRILGMESKLERIRNLCIDTFGPHAEELARQIKAVLDEPLRI